MQREVTTNETDSNGRGQENAENETGEAGRCRARHRSQEIQNAEVKEKRMRGRLRK
jgi:hypothetical protein